MGGGAGGAAQTRELGGFKVAALKLAGIEGNELRGAADKLLDQSGADMVVLAGDKGLVVKATKDAVTRGAHAGQLIGKLQSEAQALLLDRGAQHGDSLVDERVQMHFGELEALSQLESRFVEASPPPQQQRPQQQYPQQGYQQQGYGPAWGSHGNHRYRKGGFGRLFFSS